MNTVHGMLTLEKNTQEMMLLKKKQEMMLLKNKTRDDALGKKNKSFLLAHLDSVLFIRSLEL